MTKTSKKQRPPKWQKRRKLPKWPKRSKWRDCTNWPKRQSSQFGQNGLNGQNCQKK